MYAKTQYGRDRLRLLMEAKLPLQRQASAKEQYAQYNKKEAKDEWRCSSGAREGCR